jgi:hypothetical protein
MFSLFVWQVDVYALEPPAPRVTFDKAFNDHVG